MEKLQGLSGRSEGVSSQWLVVSGSHSISLIKGFFFFGLVSIEIVLTIQSRYYYDSVRHPIAIGSTTTFKPDSYRVQKAMSER